MSLCRLEKFTMKHTNILIMSVSGGCWRTIVIRTVIVTGWGGAGPGRSSAFCWCGAVVPSRICFGLRMTRTSSRGLQVVLFALLFLVTVVVFFVWRLSVRGGRTIGMKTLLGCSGRGQRGVFAGGTFLFVGYWRFAVRAIDRDRTLAIRERLCVWFVIWPGGIRDFRGIWGLVVGLLKGGSDCCLKLTVFTGINQTLLEHKTDCAAVE